MPFFSLIQPWPTLVLKSTPAHPTSAPRIPKDAPRLPQGRPKDPQGPPKDPPRALRDASKTRQGPSEASVVTFAASASRKYNKNQRISMIFEVRLFTFSTPFDVKKQPRSSPESFNVLPREPQRTPRAPQGSPKRRPRHPRGTQGTPRDPPGPPGGLQNLLKGAPSDSKAPNLPPKLKKGTQKYEEMSFLRPQSYFVHSGR